MTTLIQLPRIRFGPPGPLPRQCGPRAKSRRRGLWYQSMRRKEQNIPCHGYSTAQEPYNISKSKEGGVGFEGNECFLTLGDISKGKGPQCQAMPTLSQSTVQTGPKPAATRQHPLGQTWSQIHTKSASWNKRSKTGTFILSQSKTRNFRKPVLHLQARFRYAPFALYLAHDSSS